MDAFEQFTRGGLDWIGLTADDTDVAIMRYIDEVVGPEIRALMQADMADWWPENDFDPSRAPSA